MEFDKDKDRVHTGTVVSAIYNGTEKSIRMEIRFENGQIQKFEWPITIFKFNDGQDKEEAMIETARLLRGKKMKVMVKV
jgi:hypothetical protein